MDKEKEYLKLSVDLYDKLFSSQIEPLKYEDIPNKIGEILQKCVKKKIEVKGNYKTEYLLGEERERINKKISRFLVC